MKLSAGSSRGHEFGQENDGLQVNDGLTDYSRNIVSIRLASLENSLLVGIYGERGHNIYALRESGLSRRDGYCFANCYPIDLPFGIQVVAHSIGPGDCWNELDNSFTTLVASEGDRQILVEAHWHRGVLRLGQVSYQLKDISIALVTFEVDASAHVLPIVAARSAQKQSFSPLRSGLRH